MQRVQFLKKDRKRFFYLLCKNKGISLKKLSDKCGINCSTFKKYAKGSRLLPFNLAKKICLFNKVNIEDLRIRVYPKNWGPSKGGKKGIRTLIKNNPDKLLEWRKKGGSKSYALNFGERCILKKIKRPKMSKKFAEFIGIFLGDGTLTKEFIRIFGDNRYDQKYFNYISHLVKSLFGLKSKITKKGNLFIMTISSKALSTFLKDEFFLNHGDKIKNGTKIPEDILNNEEFIKSCLRGLIDTDGFIGKSGVNLKLAFTSHNPVLLNQLDQLNHKLKFFNRKYGNNLETCSIEKIKQYMHLVGSSNLSHIIRFNEKIKKDKLLYKHQVSNYHSKYKNYKIPFYGPVV